ncbi:general odorant-binding protein 28a [Leptopilina boulardi]|uniref:general odorant-binding protein 28a n=1 Tax=Leptopilina boulardi TaxID=63433 RepID=UPI0021F60BE2|nr:general odorant-binding protein 28a [Leptopilina boulardi]
MKYILFFAGVVLFQVMSTAYGNKEYMLACAKELGISEATLSEGPEKNKGKPEFRCFAACIMKKDGSLDANNKINESKLRENTAKYFGDKTDDIMKAGSECAEKSKAITNECDFVNAVDLCILEKIPDLPKFFKG